MSIVERPSPATSTAFFFSSANTSPCEYNKVKSRPGHVPSHIHDNTSVPPGDHHVSLLSAYLVN